MATQWLTLDDFSRHIVAWKLCATMKADDVTDTLELALAASGRDGVRARHKPRPLSDNGSSHVSGDLAEWLEGQGMDQSPEPSPDKAGSSAGTRP